MKSSHTKFTYPFNRTFPAKGHKGLASPQGASIIIKSLTSCIFTPANREAARRIFSKPVKKAGAKLNIRFLPSLSISKKPLQTRMGTGKGRPDGHISCLRRGAPLFVIHGHISLTKIKRLYRRVSFRLPGSSKLILNNRVEKNNLIYKKNIKKYK